MDSSTPQEPGFSLSKEAFCRYCRLLYERRLTAGGGGNAAARCGDRIWLTPTGRSLRDLCPEQIAVADRQGGLINGEAPTKEAGMHMAILEKRPDINVIFHVHGAWLIAASTLLDPGPSSLPALTPGFVHCAFPLPMLPFLVPGSRDLGAAVAETFSSPKVCAVLLQNHGLVTVGKDFCEALNIAEEIDEAARVLVLTRGKGRSISPVHIRDIQCIRGTDS
ncbi:MAG: hypothetical protein B5M55_05095 [Desulfococcus sp. 4484_242]|nr:MAG: hypothetical protein B5M55_05095 [Desulfococcus sp. 4484_242]